MTTHVNYLFVLHRNDTIKTVPKMHLHPLLTIWKQWIRPEITVFKTPKWRYVGYYFKAVSFG